MAPGVGEPAHLCGAVPTGVMAPGAGDPIILEFAVVFHSSPGFGAKSSARSSDTRDAGDGHDGGSQARLLGAGCAAARDGQDRGRLVRIRPRAPSPSLAPDPLLGRSDPNVPVLALPAPSSIALEPRLTAPSPIRPTQRARDPRRRSRAELQAAHGRERASARPDVPPAPRAQRQIFLLGLPPNTV